MEGGGEGGETAEAVVAEEVGGEAADAHEGGEEVGGCAEGDVRAGVAAEAAAAGVGGGDDCGGVGG